MKKYLNQHQNNTYFMKFKMLIFLISFVFIISCTSQEDKVNHPYLKGNLIYNNIDFSSNELKGAPTTVQILNLYEKDFLFNELSELDSFVQKKLRDTTLWSIEGYSLISKKVYLKNGKIDYVVDSHHIKAFYDENGNVKSRIHIGHGTRKLYQKEDFDWNEDSTRCTVSTRSIKFEGNTQHYAPKFIENEDFDLGIDISKITTIPKVSLTEVYTKNKKVRTRFIWDGEDKSEGVFSVEEMSKDSTRELRYVGGSSDGKPENCIGSITENSFNDSENVNTFYTFNNPLAFYNSKKVPTQSLFDVIDTDDMAQVKKVKTYVVQLDEEGKEISDQGESILLAKAINGKYYYMYDEKGNWIAKIWYSIENNGYVNFELRKFTYLE